MVGSPDALAFTVPTFDPDAEPGAPRAYPNVNALGNDSRRGGRKTAEYHYLRGAVREAARAAMIATGWWTADYLVDVWWQRIVVARRPYDPMNGLKCELDAMEPWEPSEREHAEGAEPFAGVYLHDGLVVPHPQPAAFDPTPGAVDRVAIAVFRRWHPLVLPPSLDRPARPVQAKRARGAGRVPEPSTVSASAEVAPARPAPSSGTRRYLGGPIPVGHVVLDGQVVREDDPLARDLLAAIRGEGDGRSRARLAQR